MRKLIRDFIIVSIFNNKKYQYKNKRDLSLFDNLYKFKMRFISFINVS